MKKKIIILLANLSFLIHIVVVLVILFGWAFSGLDLIYPLVLIIALMLESTLGYCLFTRIEFWLRKKIDPNLNYDFAYLSYFASKVLKIKVSNKLIKTVYILFLLMSLSIYYYYHFMFQ